MPLKNYLFYTFELSQIKLMAHPSTVEKDGKMINIDRDTCNHVQEEKYVVYLSCRPSRYPVAVDR